MHGPEDSMNYHTGGELTPLSWSSMTIDCFKECISAPIGLFRSLLGTLSVGRSLLLESSRMGSSIGRPCSGSLQGVWRDLNSSWKPKRLVRINLLLSSHMDNLMHSSEWQSHSTRGHVGLRVLWFERVFESFWHASHDHLPRPHLLPCFLGLFGWALRWRI